MTQMKTSAVAPKGLMVTNITSRPQRRLKTLSYNSIGTLVFEKLKLTFVFRK